VRILVVGAGSVGGYFGGRLAQAGRDVTFLVRPLRAQQLARDGLRIISPHGDVILTPKLLSAEQITQPYDIVLLSVKAYALDAAMHDFAAAVGSETMILPVLNGMHHVDLLTQKFGAAALIGGVCLVVTELDGEGRIVQMADLQQLSYGELDGKTTPRVQWLDATLQSAGFEAHLSTDILQAMWEKWVQLASLGAATCLLRGSIGDIAAAPGGADLALQVLGECCAVATACGHTPSAAFLSRITGSMTALGSSLTSSMYRDMRKGAPVEVDQILGDLLERGAARGVTTPLLKAAFVNLRVYQATVAEKKRKTP